jgi:hypothetical protein
MDTGVFGGSWSHADTSEPDVGFGYGANYMQAEQIRDLNQQPFNQQANFCTSWEVLLMY